VLIFQTKPLCVSWLAVAVVLLDSVLEETLFKQIW